MEMTASRTVATGNPDGDAPTINPSRGLEIDWVTLPNCCHDTPSSSENDPVIDPVVPSRTKRITKLVADVNT